MKRFLAAAAAVPLLSLVVFAQSAPERQLRMDVERLVAESKTIAVSGAVLGATVKGAPYSAIEVTETNHVLADGTRIHRSSQTTIYRDGEGRIRRETPDQITIYDPVAGISFFLDTSHQTARKTMLKMPITIRTGAGASAGGVAAGGHAGPFEAGTREVVASASVNGQPVDSAQVPAIVEKLRAEQKARAGEEKFRTAKETIEIELLDADKLKRAAAGRNEPVIKFAPLSLDRGEPLEKQMIEGVSCEGKRFTNTIEAGSIGNDRPIQIVDERWYSPELQIVMLTRHSDPRSGENTFRVIRVNRGEPGADLFQVPVSYRLVDGTR